jgi:collagenase-like PrtC family protease
MMAFYDAVALSSVDIVYVGTTTHAAMAGLQQRDCLAVARELAAGGKEVVLSIRGSVSMGRDGREERFNHWVADGPLAVEVGDERTFQLLAGKVPLVIGTGLACGDALTLRQRVELGAMRWAMPAACRGEFMKAVSFASDAACQVELPVLTHRQFSRWERRIDGCPYEGTPLHGMPGCDRDTAAGNIVPDWAADLATLRACGVAILRVAPRDVRAVELAQTLGELVRGEIDAPQAYTSYAASLGAAPVQGDAPPNPWRRQPGCPAHAGAVQVY